MTPVELSDPIYHDEQAARCHLEALRWPNGAACPICGMTEWVKPLGGPSMGPGWYYCSQCQDKFTVRMGTVYERSHIPLHKWLLAFRLLSSSKKGISSHQLSRTLNITYKSAWFLSHRIREAMREDDPKPLGGAGKIIEADETYWGPSEIEQKEGQAPRKKRGTAAKAHKVLSLVERGGKARSVKFEKLDRPTVENILLPNILPASTLNTDEANVYRQPGREFAEHVRLQHWRKEFARGSHTTNSVEGYFSIFKRGMIGTYQHCGEQHLQRYVDEFDFRYSNRIKLGIDDSERTERAIKGASGKRLTYRRTDKEHASLG
jgi:transposase-like protein